MNVKNLKKLGVTLAICAMLPAASNIANAQGRRGRGEERRQENQAAREQRQQERQQAVLSVALQAVGISL